MVLLQVQRVILNKTAHGTLARALGGIGAFAAVLPALILWAGAPAAAQAQSVSPAGAGKAVATYTKPLEKFSKHHNIDLPGQDYSDMKLRTGFGHNQCKHKCAAQPRCKAYTWVKAGVQGEKPHCWLKDGLPQGASHNSGTVSGIKRYSGYKFSYRNGLDIPGDDLPGSQGGGGVPAGGWKDCREKCRKNSSCWGYTLAASGMTVGPGAIPGSGPDGVCWLKGSGARTAKLTFNPRAISGVKSAEVCCSAKGRHFWAWGVACKDRNGTEAPPSKCNPLKSIKRGMIKRPSRSSTTSPALKGATPSLQKPVCCKTGNSYSRRLPGLCKSAGGRQVRDSFCERKRLPRNGIRQRQ